MNLEAIEKVVFRICTLSLSFFYNSLCALYLSIITLIIEKTKTLFQYRFIEVPCFRSFWSNKMRRQLFLWKMNVGKFSIFLSSMFVYDISKTGFSKYARFCATLIEKNESDYSIRLILTRTPRPDHQTEIHAFSFIRNTSLKMAHYHGLLYFKIE